MIRLYLRLALLPVLLFTAALLLIHAQPYDDHELHVLLLSEGCPAPCFMGIRPGVTTVEEAVKILEASGWVDELDVYQPEANSSRTARIRWIWNETAPRLFNKYPLPKFGTFRHGFIDFDDHNVVDSVLVITDIEFGAIWLLWNNQIYYRIETGNGLEETFPHNPVSWVDYGILSLKYWIQATGKYYCPVRRIRWEAMMVLLYDNNPLKKYNNFYKNNNFLPHIRSYRTFYC